MDWVKKHYDLAILGLATLLLATNAGWIGWSSYMSEESFSVDPAKPSQNDQFEKPDMAVIEKAVADATYPAKWQPDTSGAKGSLFVSRQYILRDDKLLDPIEGGEMLHPPVPNSWFVQNNLDISITNILNGDSDSDYFSNLEEFYSKTNPQDKKSTPPYYTKIKFSAYKSVRFPLIFMGDPNMGDPKKEGQSFDFNLKEANGKIKRFNVETTINNINLLGTQYKIVPASYIQKPALGYMQIENNKKYYLVSLAGNTSQYFSINITKNNPKLLIKTTGLEDNYDVYLQYEAPPRTKINNYTTNDYFFKSTINDANQNLQVDINKPGNYFIKLNNIKDNDNLRLNFTSENNTLTIDKVKEVEAGFESPRGFSFPNQSELKIENTVTGETLTLTYKKEKDDPTSLGEFHNLITNQMITLKKGEEFTIPPDTKKFKLLEVNENSAQIKDLDSGDTITIPRKPTPFP